MATSWIQNHSTTNMLNQDDIILVISDLASGNTWHTIFKRYQVEDTSKKPVNLKQYAHSMALGFKEIEKGKFDEKKEQAMFNKLAAYGILPYFASTETWKTSSLISSHNCFHILLDYKPNNDTLVRPLGSTHANSISEALNEKLQGKLYHAMIMGFIKKKFNRPSLF